jgi:hypothetical protein
VGASSADPCYPQPEGEIIGAIWHQKRHDLTLGQILRLGPAGDPARATCEFPVAEVFGRAEKRGRGAKARAQRIHHARKNALRLRVNRRCHLQRGEPGFGGAAIARRGRKSGHAVSKRNGSSIK